MQTLLITLIRIYRLLIAPLMGRHCRFEPSCSAYALNALQKYGAAKGGWLTLKRLGRCHPWHPGGFDPVPGPDSDNHACKPRPGTINHPHG